MCSWVPRRILRGGWGRSWSCCCRTWMSGRGGWCWGRWRGLPGTAGSTAVARAGAAWQTVADGAAELESGDCAVPGRVRRAGGGPQALGGRGSAAGAGAAGAGGGSARGGSEVAAAVDDEVGRDTCPAELTGAGAPVRRGTRWRGCCMRGVQPAGQRQDDRGQAASGPGRPVPLHQRAGAGAHGRRGAGDQRGHQEEGAGRAVRARPGGSGGRPGTRCGSATMTSPTGAGQGDPVRGLRRGRQRRVRQRGHRSRHRRVRGGVDPPLVEHRRQGPLPGRAAAAGHRRCRRLQRVPDPGVEDRAGRARRRDRAGDHRAATSRPGTSKWNKIEHRLFSHIT